MADVVGASKAEEKDDAAHRVFLNKVAFATSELALRSEYTNLLSIKDLLSGLEQKIIGLGNAVVQPYFILVDKAIESIMNSVRDILSQPKDGEIDFGKIPVFDISGIERALELLRKDCTNVETRDRLLQLIRQQNDIIDAQFIEIGGKMDGLKAMLPVLPSNELLQIPSMLGFTYLNRGEVAAQKVVAQESTAIVELGALPLPAKKTTP